MQKILFVFLIVIALFVLLRGFMNVTNRTFALIDGHIFVLEVADTPEEIMRGLSYREFLGEDKGMLFVMPSTDIHEFWMNEMRFDLDFIWLDRLKIVEITTNVPAPRYSQEDPIRLKPSVPVNKVIELKAGTLESIQVKPGHRVWFW
jgi:uncharacterized protein